MARCAGCGTPNTDPNARFCKQCGAPLGGPAPTVTNLNRTQPSGTTSMPAAPYNAAPDTGDGKGKVYAAAGAGAVIVLIAALIFAKTSGLLGANKTDAPKTAVLSAPRAAPVAAPLINAPPVAAPQTAAPVLDPPKAADNKMPADVIDYLRWLKRFENARAQLKARSESQMVLIMGNMIKAPLQELMKEPDEQSKSNTISPISKEDFAMLSQIGAEWNQAAGSFQQKAPPNPCAPLAASYGGMLNTVIQQQTALQQTLETTLRQLQETNGNATPDVQQTLQKLYGERSGGGMSRSADATFGSANAALDALRAKYTDIPQDIDGAHFSIQDESKVAVPNAPVMPGIGF